MTRPPPIHRDVKSVLDAHPVRLRDRLYDLRTLIFRAARETDGVGDLIETLKWGEPAYLPRRPRTGTTIRLNALRGSDEDYALYVHCQTSLIATYRELYPETFRFRDNRALVFNIRDEIPKDPLRHCIALALTYHLKR